MFRSKTPPPDTSKPAPSISGHKNIRGQFHYDSEKEIESNLAGGRYKREFYKMSLNDPICGAILLALTKTFQSIDWKPKNDHKGVLAKSLQNVRWRTLLEDILTQFIYGHSLIEITLKEDTEGDVVWNRAYYRPQTTLGQWKHNKIGDFTHVEQQTDLHGPVDIPLKNCLLFNTIGTQNNPEGKSLFRNAYRDWYYKTNIEKIEAIGIERDLTGLPVLSAPEDVELVDEKGQLNGLGNWAWKTVRDIKRNSQEGLVLPPNWEFELVGSPGQRQFDLNAVINRFSNNIALSMLNQFIVLGVTNDSGSFALAREQASLFYTAVEGFAYMLAEVVNTQFIGSPALHLFNGLKDRPYLEPIGIEKVDIGELGTLLTKLLKYNAITPDDRLEAFIRDKANMPEQDKSTSRAAIVTPEEPDEEETEEEMEEEDDNTNKPSEGGETDEE